MNTPGSCTGPEGILDEGIPRRTLEVGKEVWMCVLSDQSLPPHAGPVEEGPPEGEKRALARLTSLSS